MKVQKISGKVVKRGRKWLKIVQNGRNEKYPEDLLINTLTENLKEGDTFENMTVETTCEERYVGGYKFTHTAVTEESMAQKEIERWWGYVKKTYDEDDRIYSNGVSKLHELGCHEYDKEIEKMRKDIDVRKAIYWIRRNFKEKEYIYEKGVETLKKYDVHEFDDEINEMRKEIAENKKIEESKYVYWDENADLNYRLEKGEIVIKDGKVIKVLSSHYYGEEAELGYPWSVYRYKGMDISSTDKGKEVIAEHIKKEEQKKIELELEKKKASVLKQLMSTIENNDILNKEKTSMPKGNIIYDTMNIYGGGCCVVIDEQYAWYVINNGSDGGFWAINHITTGGAGAYGYKCEVSKVSELINEFCELQGKKARN